MKKFFIIFFAVFLANVAAGSVFKLWIEYEAKIALEKVNEELAESSRSADAKRLKAQKDLQVAREKQQKKLASQHKENIARAAISKKHWETCHYWRSQYNKTRKSYDKSMENVACKLAKNGY